MSEPIVVTLTRPFEYDGTTYTELVFNRPLTMRDVVATTGKTDPVDYQLALHASMAGIPYDAILEMSETDFFTMVREVATRVGKPSSSSPAQASAGAAPPTQTAEA